MLIKRDIFQHADLGVLDRAQVHTPFSTPGTHIVLPFRVARAQFAASRFVISLRCYVSLHNVTFTYLR
jgi:hypothetical protein